MSGRLLLSPAERFVSKVERGDGCWIWRGAHVSDGYGHFRVGPARVVRAHRFAYELWVGEIPEGLMVIHSCDVRDCVNPEHLRVGTNQDNMDDRNSRGRTQHHGRGGNFWPTNRHSKLTPDLVRQLRADAATGVSFRELGRRYGLDHKSAASIVRRRFWKDVD